MNPRFSVAPALILLGLAMPLAFASLLTVVPKRLAREPRVSPDWMVYVWGAGALGRARGSGTDGTWLPPRTMIWTGEPSKLVAPGSVCPVGERPPVSAVSGVMAGGIGRTRGIGTGAALLIAVTAELGAASG